MASGFPGRKIDSGFQVLVAAGSESGRGGILKRRVTEMERLRMQHQMQLQQELFLRSVRQRTLLPPPVSSRLSPPLPPVAFSPESISAAQSVARSGAEDWCSTTVRDQLVELERRLLLDEEGEETDVSASGSAVTTEEWSQAMQLLMTPTPATALPPNLLSPSRSSSSSTGSSSASFSPPSSSAVASSPRKMLFDTATAIADGNIEAATANLAVLNRVANPRGERDAEQRLTAVMVATLVSRLNPPKGGSASPPFAALYSAEHFAATQMLYELSPCFKLGLLAANSAILEATKDQPKIHIIDFEVGQGGQYAAIFQALAERHRLRPFSLRITAVSDPNYDSSSHLRTVRDRIEMLAGRNGLSVRFSIVQRRVVEIDAAALGCEPGEALAVNLAFSLSYVPDESVSPTNPRDELLRRVRALAPRVVTLVEQEINTNTAAFTGRFAEACGHYGALFESLDATMARDNAERTLIEAGLARRVVNSVAREEADRVERCEVFGKWRARMGMAGFEPVPLGPAVIESVRKGLASLRYSQGFTIKEEAGGLGLGWKGRVISVASSWRYAGRN